MPTNDLSKRLTSRASKTAQRQRNAAAKSSGLELSTNQNDSVLTLRSSTIRTLDAALKEGKVDTSEWEVERWTLNKWDSAAKLTIDGDDTLAATELWQVKVWLKRRTPQERSVISLLDEIRKYGKIKLLKRSRNTPKPSTPRRQLEISIMDTHFGLRCHKPGSDDTWSLEECEQIYLWALEDLLAKAKANGPYEAIVLPFGNDYLHADNVHHTTTAGTAQPESESWHHTFEQGKRLLITAVERMRKVAPVIAYQIPGNHDRQSSFAMGHILDAYYHNASDVSVDCSSSPYKFHQFGCNLIGFEHGHSIAAQRLPALMANEVPDLWAATANGYREWHLGDQHRKATGKPSHFEEQGVSVEYLPALTPPNEWHRLKGYNWQKRGALAYVWDYDEGQVSRFACNLGKWKERVAA